MSFKNTYNLNVDIKEALANPTPTFKQGESGRLTFKIFDNGKLFDLTSFTHADITFRLRSGKVLKADATLENGLVTYSLTEPEMAEIGSVAVTLDVYSSNSKVSIQPLNMFIYDKMDSDSISYIAQLQNLIEAVQVLETEAGIYANAQGDYAQSIADSTKYSEPYSDLTQYSRNNVVTFNGSSYMAKKSTIGNPPPLLPETQNEFWGMLGRKGTDATAIVAVYKDTFTATEGQTIFTLSHNYDQFQNRTEVLVGGVPQRTPENYEEAGQNLIILTSGVPAGTIVEVKYFGEAIPIADDVRTVVNNHTTEINKFNNQGVYEEEFIATEGQTVFTLQTTYDQLQHKVEVWVDGLQQDSGDNFIESANNQITLTEGVPAGTEVKVRYFGKRIPVQTDVEVTLNNHAVEISKNTVGLVDVNEQLAQIVINISQFPRLALETDDTQRLQRAIDYVHNNGGGIINLGKGIFEYTSIVLKQNVRLSGLNSFTDGNNKTDLSDAPTVLYPKSLTEPSIILYGGASVEGVCFEYKDQIKEIANETDSLIEYPPTIQLGTDTEQAVGNHIRNILLMGCTTFIEQFSFVKSVEKLYVENVYGMVNKTFANLKKCFDIPRFNNIHLNLNTIQFNWLTGDTAPYYSKLAKECTVFKLARVDEIMVSNSFAFGVKHFVHFYRDADLADDGKYGGGTFVNCAVDITHQALRIDREAMNFGVRWIGGAIVPLVKLDGAENCAVAIGTQAKNTNVQLIGIRQFGTTNPVVVGSGHANYIVVFEDSNPTEQKMNFVTLVGSFADYQVDIAKNESTIYNNSATLIGTDKFNVRLKSRKADITDLTVANTLIAKRIEMTDSRVILYHGAGDMTSFRVNGTGAANDVFSAKFDSTDGALFVASKYSKNGNTTTLPTPSATYRGYNIRVEGGTGVADKDCVCVKKADNSYGWFDRISGTFVS